MKFSKSRLIVLAVVALSITGELYDEHKLHYLKVSETSTLTTSFDVYKHGDRALKWSWKPGDLLTLDLSDEPIHGRQLVLGGIKIWLYLPKSIPAKMTLSFYRLVPSGEPAQPECEFTISLEFTGWRAAWVSFQECKLGDSMAPIYFLRIRSPFWHAGVIYIDLLTIVRQHMGKQSRDHIVPPIRGAARPRSIWQQAYHWSAVKPSNDVFNELELNNEQLRHLKHIRLIKTRLRDWYRVKGKSTLELTGYYRTRWFRLRTKIKRARRYLQSLNITKTKDGFIKGPPLFSRNSEYGKQSILAPDIKFGFMFRDVLLPLAFEYSFASRKEEISKIVEMKLPDLNDPKRRTKTLQKLVGFDKEFINLFYDKFKLGAEALTKHRLRMALREVNHKRYMRIERLFEYIIDQGWAAGSALGSLDHELIRSSKGFVTSVFLLRKVLRKSGLLPRLIDTMKWYLEFGELYQNPFESPGTTADRLRTLFLYRLMCILVMPETTLNQVLEKLRDMRALSAWHENALSINPALGGTIKPDYTGYHHMSFYPNDYVLPALLTASQVLYLLRGTVFQISETGRNNLRNAIHFMRLLSEQYAIPNSVTNASPTTVKPELICLIPAFAYVVSWEEETREILSETTRNKHARRQWTSIQSNLVRRSSSSRDYSAGSRSRRMKDTHYESGGLFSHKQYNASLRVFLRMLNESNRDVQAYLRRGKGCSWKSSDTFSLGSLSLLHKLKQRATDLGVHPEPTPQGNWAKNFAALSIHRRQRWVVTVKGFNNFVWGHESSNRGNPYGRYQSYGQVLIANTDHGLKAYDIDRGWDWTRLPGTTALRVPVEQLRDKETRFYNPKSLCGAMHFRGTNQFRNGVFTMDFERPRYNDKAANFWFKKSVFFYDELLVCIGSDIRAFGFRPTEVETTLFQNIGQFGDKTHSIRLNGYEIPLGKQQEARRFMWERNSPGLLMDVNHNGYYIVRAGGQNLNVWLRNQTSVNTRKVTGGYFSTAVLRHGSNPTGTNYEYAILVNTSYEKLYKLARVQQKLLGIPKYEVLRQDSSAHVVKFNNSPRLGATTYGYSVFTRRAFLPGPLRMVGDPCVLMAEDGGKASTRLVIGVSYPQLNFNSTKKMRTSGDARQQELYYMRSQEMRIWVLLRARVQRQNIRVYVDGKEVDRKDAHGYVRILSLYGEANAGALVHFTKLYNGFTTEVHLRRMA